MNLNELYNTSINYILLSLKSKNVWGSWCLFNSSITVIPVCEYIMEKQVVRDAKFESCLTIGKTALKMFNKFE